MPYEDFLIALAQSTGINYETVKRVLFYVPDVLATLPEGKTVRTPMGTFKKVSLKERHLVMPDGKTPATIPAKTVVRLSPGCRLIRQEGPDQA